MIRRRPLDRSGVSEVVGTILILLITVIIFSSIILWVYTIPTPTATGRVSFSGSLTWSEGVGGGAYINLTHLGGDNLLAGNTRIYLTIDNTTDALLTRGTIFDGEVQPYGVNGPDANWNIGEVWSYRNQTIPRSAAISVLVVDTDKGVVLWQNNLLGTTGANTPVFLDKWVDGDPDTPVTREPALLGKKWTLFARVIDPDGDLNPASVMAYLTFGSGICPPGPWSLSSVGQDTFSRTFSCPVEKSWDGGIIILNATDDGGREMRTRLILKVGEGGGAGNITFSFGNFGFGSEVQRYDIFEETDWDSNLWNATSTRTFVKGQTAVVVVISQYLRNVANRNLVLVHNQTLPISPIVYGGGPVGETTRPSSSSAFTSIGSVGTFYVYEYRFSTNATFGPQLEFGYYSVEIELQASGVSPPFNRFATADTIAVTDTDGTVPLWPILEFFMDAAHTQPSNVFNFTDIVYVKVTVNRTDSDLDEVQLDTVSISDGVGATPVLAKGGEPPVGSIYRNDTTSYGFTVDLSAPNRDNWLFDTNSYVFTIHRIADSDEEYTLTKQMTVRGPRWQLDVFTGLNQFTFKWFGADETWYSTFYENDGSWSRTIVESHRKDCFFILCSEDPEWGGGDFLDVALDDLDGDGDLDGIVGTERGRVFWYRNSLGTGEVWDRYQIDNLGNSVRVQAVASGLIDRDSLSDVVAGTSDGRIWLYLNDGVWTSLLVDKPTPETAINVIKVADVTGDGFNDLVVGTQSGHVRIYINNQNGIFGFQQISDYLLQQDIWIEGTSPDGSTYVQTQISDDDHEAIQEEVGPGEAVDVFLADSDELANIEGPAVGVLDNTWTADGVYYTLNEEFTTWLFGLQWTWAMRDSRTSSSTPGHKFFWSEPPTGLNPSDRVLLVVRGYISDGAEPMDVLLCASCSTNPQLIGTFTETAPTTKYFDLTEMGYAGGDIRIDFRDTDVSHSENSGGDGKATALSIDYLALHVISESGQTGRLEHVWRTSQLQDGGQAYRAFVEGHFAPGVDIEDFRFQWSTSAGGPWTDMFVLTKTIDDDKYQSALLDPDTVGGRQIYIRVRDLNRTPDALMLDTLFIDHVFVRRYVTIPDVQIISLSGNPPVNDISVGDINKNGAKDIVVAASGAARIYYGPNWATSTALVPTGTVLAVDVGYIDSDDRLDVVTGSSDGRVYWFANDGTWRRRAVGTMSGAINTLRVGDVDGDYWDDVVIGTEDGYVRVFRNGRGGPWLVRLPDIDKLDTAVLSLDIGDADRGVIIDPAQYES